MSSRFSGVIATGRMASLLVVTAWASTGCLPGRCDTDRDCPMDYICVEQTVFSVCAPLGAGGDAGHPSCTAELCNGLDDDCDGVVDEPPEGGFLCYPTDEGLGDPTIGVGRCTTGRSTACVGGVVRACAGAVVPTAELCNGLDDDCDGVIDRAGIGGLPVERRCALAEGCPDDLEGLLPQAPGDLRCCVGVQQCEMGRWGDCSGGNADGQRVGEVCNGLDDDCDGISDERAADDDPPVADPARAGEMDQLGFDCVSLGVPGREGGVGDVTPGACRRYGVIACDRSAEAVACSAAAVAPGVESCATPSVPEGLYSPRPGGERVEGVPEYAVIPHTDEDCDGRFDELDGAIGVPADVAAEVFAVGEPCTIGLGACLSRATLTCSEAGDAFLCDAEVIPPGVEVCGVGPGGSNDEDCDGRVDEGETGRPIIEACGTSLGVCIEGTRTCINGSFGACQGPGDARTEADPAVREWCDGQNNDCDGAPEDADRGIDSDGSVDELCSCLGPELEPGVLGDASMAVRTRPENADRANVLSGSCGGADAPEVALNWTSPSGGLWRFRARSAAGDDSDPVIYLTRSCAASAKDPLFRDEGREVACGDDDGAVRLVPGEGGAAFRDATRFGASAVTWRALPGDNLKVIVDGAGVAAGEWVLDTQRIDRAPDRRSKQLAVVGPMGITGVREFNSRCLQRVVRLDKTTDPVAIEIQDNVGGYCLDNDGGYRAMQLDGGGLVQGSLEPEQTISVYGRLLPRAVDEADWFSVRLADADRGILDIDLSPPHGLPVGLDADFEEDQRRCLGEWTRVVALVACTEGEASVPGCPRDELTGAAHCLDDNGYCFAELQEARRSLSLRLGDPVCPAPGAEPILFVGVLRADEQVADCPCSVGDDHQVPTPDRSVTYELSISLQ